MTDALDDFFAMLAARAVKTRRTRELLRQDGVWMDRDGVVHRVEEMSRRYCAVVVRFLERRAALLHDGECAEWAFLPEPNGEQASFDFHDETDRLHAMDAAAWLDDQPLVRALRARAGDAKARPSAGWLAKHPAVAVKLAGRAARRRVTAS